MKQNKISNNKWFLDDVNENEMHYHKIKKCIFKKQTLFQELEVIEFEALGKCLVIDDDLQSAELDELMKRSDIITVHLPVNSDTLNLINAERVFMMKPSAYLINTASTFVVDNEAMIKALKEKRIAGAGFDVYETWPVQPDSPLLDLDNVVLTPHIGGATYETIERYSTMIVDDVERFFKGERPKHIKNPQVLQKHG